MQSKLPLKRVHYPDLNAKQKETYNFQKVAARLGEYGYNCILLSDDWLGADFLAHHNNAKDIFRVQLKGRFTLDKKYSGKDLYIAFFHGERCFVYPHDIVVARVEAEGRIMTSRSWAKLGSYTWPSIPKWAFGILEEYEIPS